jgi:hypothetical protein
LAAPLAAQGDVPRVERTILSEKSAAILNAETPAAERAAVVRALTLHGAAHVSQQRYAIGEAQLRRAHDLAKANTDTYSLLPEANYWLALALYRQKKDLRSNQCALLEEGLRIMDEQGELVSGLRAATLDLLALLEDAQRLADRRRTPL